MAIFSTGVCYGSCPSTLTTSNTVRTATSSQLTLKSSTSFTYGGPNHHHGPSRLSSVATSTAHHHAVTQQLQQSQVQHPCGSLRTSNAAQSTHGHNFQSGVSSASLNGGNQHGLSHSGVGSSSRKRKVVLSYRAFTIEALFPITQFPLHPLQSEALLSSFNGGTAGATVVGEGSASTNLMNSTSHATAGGQSKRSKMGQQKKVSSMFRH